MAKPTVLSLILDRLDQQDDQLNRIEGKVDKTNGNVRDLQLWRAKVEGTIGGIRASFRIVPALIVGVTSALVAASLSAAVYLIFG